MKIIKLGDFNFRFMCPDCGTEFEIESKELKKDKYDYFDSDGYYIECPLCDKILYINDSYENANGVNVIIIIMQAN